MKRKSEYRKLAEEIAENIYGIWWCCTKLSKPKAKKFKSIFEPTKLEKKEYNHLDFVWMANINSTRSENNNFRILALLFMDEFTKTDKNK